MRELLFKSLICLLLLVFVMNICTVISYADNFNFSDYENGNADISVRQPFSDAIGAILNVMRIIGTAVAIIIIIVVGMKYMIAAPTERADLKKSSIQYVVGAVILFGSTNILAALISTIGALVGNGN